MEARRRRQLGAQRASSTLNVFTIRRATSLAIKNFLLFHVKRRQFGDIETQVIGIAMADSSFQHANPDGKMCAHTFGISD